MEKFLQKTVFFGSKILIVAPLFGPFFGENFRGLAWVDGWTFFCYILSCRTFWPSGVCHKPGKRFRCFPLRDNIRYGRPNKKRKFSWASWTSEFHHILYKFVWGSHASTMRRRRRTFERKIWNGGREPHSRSNLQALCPCSPILDFRRCKICAVLLYSLQPYSYFDLS